MAFRMGGKEVVHHRTAAHQGAEGVPVHSVHNGKAQVLVAGGGLSVHLELEIVHGLLDLFLHGALVRHHVQHGPQVHVHVVDEIDLAVDKGRVLCRGIGDEPDVENVHVGEISALPVVIVADVF